MVGVVHCARGGGRSRSGQLGGQPRAIGWDVSTCEISRDAATVAQSAARIQNPQPRRAPPTPCGASAALPQRSSRSGRTAAAPEPPSPPDALSGAASSRRCEDSSSRRCEDSWWQVVSVGGEGRTHAGESMAASAAAAPGCDGNARVGFESLLRPARMTCTR
eukprot:2594542-Prymnesium_polylepis.1